MSESNDSRNRRGSDVPLDLIKERDEFVRSFLKKGVEYTEQLLGENEELRDEIAELRRTNARLRAQVASDDAIRELLVTVDELKAERDRLVKRSKTLEVVEAEHAGRQEAIDQEINDLANLYVASVQLHASLSPRRVVRHICDMMGQLVGAESFVVYLLDAARKVLVPLAQEGLDEDAGTVAVGGGPIGEAILTAMPRVVDGDLHAGSLDSPVAVIPMIVDGRAIGAVTVVRVLKQKTEWANVDRELFHLVSTQGGMALVASNLYESAESPQEALAGLPEKLSS